MELTARNKKLLGRIEPLYAKQVKKIMAPLNRSELKRLITKLEKIRSKLPR